MFQRIKHGVRQRLVQVVHDATQPQIEAAVQRLSDELRSAEFRSRRDLYAAAERAAAESSADYLGRAMTRATAFDHPHATLRHAIELAPTGGLALEFGVFSGRTLRVIADGRSGGVYGFDSFDGLPEDWRPGFPAGTFGVSEPPVVPGAEIVVGLFADTLPGFLEEHPGPVDLLHVDCDLYSSTVTVLDLVGPRLAPGSIVVFDEYFNHQNWQDGEHRAWLEFVERAGLTYEYVAYTYHDEQVVVRVTGT